MHSKNLHLGYIGGSGGFLVLHLLLLSNYYVNNLSENLTSIIQHHWNVTDHTQWKKSEVWPNNNSTLSMPGDQKLFFHLNPSVDLWRSITEKKLLLYTDFASQLKLSKYKNAWVYLLSENTRMDLDCHFESFYNNIKDPYWPNCCSIEQSLLLDPAIRDEMLTHKDYQNFLQATSWEEWSVLSNQDCKLNNDIVEHTVPALAQCSDYVIKLQDIVNSNAECLLTPLGLPVLESHLTLLEKWKSLHTIELLEQIGIICSN